MSGPGRRQRGASLIDALLAGLVLALGVLALTRAQWHFQSGAEAVRQQSEALRRLQSESDRLRATLHAGARDVGGTWGPTIALGSAGAPPGESTDPGSPRHGDAVEHALDAADPRALAARVAARWTDRAGEERRVALDAIVGPGDPRHSAALVLPPAGAAAVSPFGRSMAVPLTARSLGNGRSAFKPRHGGTTAWIVDDATGALVSTCEVAAHRDDAELEATHLSACRARAGRILSGHVRVALDDSPTLIGNDNPLGLDVRLDGTGSGHASSCTSQAMQTMATGRDGRTALRSVPLDASAASIDGMPGWHPTGERYLVYRCILPADAPADDTARPRVVVVAGGRSGAGSAAPHAAGGARTVSDHRGGERAAPVGNRGAGTATDDGVGPAPSPRARGGAGEADGSVTSGAYRTCRYDDAARPLAIAREGRAGAAVPLRPQNFLLVSTSATCPTGTRAVEPI